MSELDALSALLGERMERQHREMMKAAIAAGVIGAAACEPKPPDVSPEEFMERVCTGAWVIADLAMNTRDELVKTGKLPP